MPDIKTISLPLVLPSGIDECGRCLNRLKDALMQIEGIISIDVNPKTSMMTLAYDPHLTPINEVEKRAESIGFELQKKYLHKTFRLTGIDCPDCALLLEKGVGKLDGVLWVSVSFASARISVEYEPGKVDIGVIVKRIRDLGHDIVETTPKSEALSETAQPGNPIATKINKQTILTLIAGCSIILAYISSLNDFELPSKILYGIAAVAGGFYAARGAVYSLRSLILDMNFLMTIAVIGAIAIGQWFDAAMVMFLFSLGNTLEARTMERTRDSVRSLLDNFPVQARVRRDGIETFIQLENLRVNDTFIVLPGEKVPTDGIISIGSTSINQASITGESTPVEKSPRDTVFAGSINMQGAFEAIATSTAADNTLTKIIHLVEEAQAEKAPSQRFTEAFGRYYTPIVIVLAILTAGVPPLFFDAQFIPWLHKALTLLVVSCPCALVISTPVSIVSAIGNAAHNGILIKGGTHLENTAKIDVIAFDKTGTLTSGEPSVTDLIPTDGYKDSELISIAAGVESRSEHPLAKAILKKADSLGTPYNTALDFEALTGMGASAVIDAKQCLVGNPKLMEQHGIDIRFQQEIITSLQEVGKTVIIVAIDGKPAGVIAISDTIRSTAKEAIQELKRIGIKHIVMLTGDHEKTARSVADELGVDEYYTELLPQDKVDVVRKLVSKYGHHIAFIGDGVNDAPALASATVGFAMGVAGSDTALETADVALMSNDLRRIPYAIRLGRKSLDTIRYNVGFALVVILLLISTALMGWINLSLGVFGHEGSALIVILNGMRLLKFK
ncbi:MAG: heavy metal translocating P-type ATPase [Armatimonadota bacterium]